MMERTDFSQFKEKALENPEVRKEYEKLQQKYELKTKLIALRKLTSRLVFSEQEIPDIYEYVLLSACGRFVKVS